ncbi:CotH kinase family protein [Roseimarinus sediminis]|uniref:CotH kinase family protein n=1 Tax=Roseimarinus sediminis TaxID=1610899 RepID=UPI003D1F5049
MHFVPFFISFILFQLTCAGSFNPENQPGNVQENMVFSHESGFYTTPFALQITTSLTDGAIFYTIDGSDPSSSDSAKKGGKKVSIEINPDITAGRGRTPAFIVRAVLKAGNTIIAPSLTKSYIFANKVKQQKSPGYNWPSKKVNAQLIDYEMADDVLDNSQYSIQLPHALSQIPTISLVTDMAHLFDPETGIYVNAEKKGKEWERPCSVELINPNDGAGFQVNAGLRIRGGNSAKNKNNPKHAFRLFFREEYGAKKLNFPLFDNEGAEAFDCIDLRCEQNYSWSMDGSSHNTMVKDIFCRDLQREMGQPYKRGRYYHLYLNGMYWGIYQSDERAEASFAESYFEGDKEDFDVVKVNTQPWPYYVEATDGNLDAWEALWNLCKSGFKANENYFALEGKDENGKKVPNGKVLVELDNLIDYMLVIFYSGNFDAPVSGWYSNDMPNNFYAIYNREDQSKGFRFLVHDSEHSMFVDRVYGFSGINENRVNLGSSCAMNITNAGDFNPQWLHHKLTANAEYRLRFADRAWHCFSKGGVLSPEKTEALFRSRVQEIDRAIVAESARWGDAQSTSSLTMNDHWLPEINKMYSDFFPKRSSIVILQLKNEKLWINGECPLILVDGAEISQSLVTFDEPVEVDISNNGSGGTIYYTLNNTDPRQPGGALSAGAKAGGTQVQLSFSDTEVLWTRIKYSDGWGPSLKTVFRNSKRNFDGFKVTELHYHPSDVIEGSDTIAGKDFEFIEFRNIGASNIDLSGAVFESGIEYIFPNGTILEPRQFYVLASKPNRFFERYGIHPSGNYKKNLSNSGELIQLLDGSANEILSFEYSDKAPWPEEADGDGYSLTSLDSLPQGNPGLASYWKASAKTDGSPFANDDYKMLLDPIDEPLFRMYPNPTSQLVRVLAGEGRQSIHLSCFDLTGSLVFKVEVSDGAIIDLASYQLKPGMYLMKAENDRQVHCQRLMFRAD